MPEAYKGQYRDRRLVVGAGVALALVGTVAGVNKAQDLLDNRPACIDVPVEAGESGPMLVERVTEAGLEPAGDTVLFRNVDGQVLRSDDGFPSYKGSTELDLVDQVGFERADQAVCQEIGGTVMPELVQLDKN